MTRDLITNTIQASWLLAKNYVFPTISFMAAIYTFLGVSGHIVVTISDSLFMALFVTCASTAILLFLIKYFLQRVMKRNCFSHEVIDSELKILFFDPKDGKPFPQARYEETTVVKLHNNSPNLFAARGFLDKPSEEFQKKMEDTFADYKVEARRIIGKQKKLIDLENRIQPRDLRLVDIDIRSTEAVTAGEVIQFVETQTAERDQYKESKEYYELTVDSLIKKHTFEVHFGPKNPSYVVFEKRLGGSSSPVVEKQIRCEKDENGHDFIRYTIKGPKIGERLKIAWEWKY